MNPTSLTHSIEAAGSATAYRLARAWSAQGNNVYALVAAANLLTQAEDRQGPLQALHAALEAMRESPAEFALLHLLAGVPA